MTTFKRPESVLVLIYARDGQVLLLGRQTPPGYWQSVTGSLAWGESPAAAAGRELREETGFTAPAEDCHIQNRFGILPAWRARYAPQVNSNLEHVFRVVLPEAARPQLSVAEHRAFLWLPLSEAIARASSLSNRYALSRCHP